MLQLLTRSQGARQTAARRFLAALGRAVRSAVAPAAFAERTPVVQATMQVPDPADTYGEDEMPELNDIERAAASYAVAADQARAADRGKRAARKLLDRLPAGQYGAWLVSRKSGSRQTPDLEEIRRIFTANGLGEVPMRSCAASLVVTRAAADAKANEPTLIAA